MKYKLVRNRKEHNLKNHAEIKGIQILNEKNLFPISWLNQQGYCEYSLYLEHFKKIETMPTQAMVEGVKEHKKLEDKFNEIAVECTFSETLGYSKEEKIISREFFVLSEIHGIMGYIDEIWMMPSEFIIIDDKPGKIPYHSLINQVLAYALAFKSMIGEDNRKIKVALRERGTDNIFWIDEFDENNENSIKFLINRMNGLFEGIKPFIPTKNKNKCNKCRFQSYCEHF
ncbi:CRISPR-associated protein Cas4 [Methanobrevibacter filiformis]|uniref:PD-(D/E)XK nuclease superfamily protein n=1 Tax=Methanobrevibacter filiformis TaxID=55758 RepID=A0A166DAF0_9EURY|nr:PD-(D/E)XK nuclease family protein [Methanobrevibacter filiformis]KZX15378.1 PD-(D/E)XK nuclease superfamily protein [Methanobrevibacter filiformis]